MNIKSSPMAAALAVAGLLAASSASAATIAKDQATGELRAPTAAEAQALSQPAASGGRSSSKVVQPRGLLTGRINPQPVVHADGTVEQELDESTLSYTVATRNADGSISEQCVTGPTAAAAALKASPKSTALNAKTGHNHELK